MGEGLHVCGYERCGRSFATPVRLTDLSHKPRSETYYACPYCFSKMDECGHDVDGSLKTGKSGSHSIDSAEVSAKALKNTIQKELEKETSVVSCPHHVGYLKSRSKDQAVPDSCLTCPKILQCMV